MEPQQHIQHFLCISFSYKVKGLGFSLLMSYYLEKKHLQESRPNRTIFNVKFLWCVHDHSAVHIQYTQVLKLQFQ